MGTVGSGEAVCSELLRPSWRGSPSRPPPLIIECPSLHHMPLQGSMRALHGGPLSVDGGSSGHDVPAFFLFLFNVSDFRQKTPSQPPFQPWPSQPEMLAVRISLGLICMCLTAPLFCHPMNSRLALKILLKSPASGILARFPKLEEWHCEIIEKCMHRSLPLVFGTELAKPS